ncbi:DciA family protein [Streptomyces sp. JV176]|uniref:DciA family protein n=1 Tax=unclassified Streptomyces TaxID=2593676 RepID=UPI002E7A6FC2|nr:DciA family protein [Streptomyces sp. JV176]MEE1798391.1 DciA family protein [Streptomyces sp. JV176]
MTTPAQPSGVDLARQALVAAREAAKKNGNGPVRKARRRTVTVRRDGREPYGLGEAITAMMTERAWRAPAADGSLLAQWHSILTTVAPELAGHARAVRFHAESGKLDIVPDAPAYGTKLRWTAPKLIARPTSRSRTRTSAPSTSWRPPHPRPPHLPRRWRPRARNRWPPHFGWDVAE